MITRYGSNHRDKTNIDIVFNSIIIITTSMFALLGPSMWKISPQHNHIYSCKGHSYIKDILGKKSYKSISCYCVTY